MALYPDSMYDFPNVSAYDSDLREVLAMLRGLTHEMRDFKVINKITNAGAWDITKQYKPWTIVSDNNIGYISVRPVPAGIEITNTDYWALVADYDILITNLSERISTLETQMNVTTVPAIARKLNDFIDLMTKCRFIFIADSLANYTNNDGKNFIKIACDNVGISASDYEDLHAGGYGFYDDQFLSLLQGATISDPDSVTDIIIFCGWNDLQHLSDLNTYIGNFTTYAHTNYKNAKISLGIDVWSPYENQDLAYFRNLVPAFMEACRQHHIRFIPNCNSAMHATDFYASDGVHPSADGVTQLGKILTAAILNEDGFVPINDTVFTMAPASGSMSAQLFYRVCENGLKIWSDWASNLQMHMAFNNPVSLSNNAYSDIGELSLTGWNSLDPHHNAIHTTAIITVNGTDYRDNISFYIKGGHIYMIDHSNVRNNVTDIYLLPFSAMLDMTTN